MTVPRLVVAALACLFAFVSPAAADEVLDWNAIMVREVTRPGAVPGPLHFRASSIVHAAMFDALNGIERRYGHIHVEPDAPRGASRRAAVVQAAYTALTGIIPSADLEDELESSLANIASDEAVENSQSIARGRLWGEQVAIEILAWRAADALGQTMPPTTGNNAPGQWRPTPPGFAAMAVPSMGDHEPWVIESVLDFRPAPPLSLTSAEYAAELALVRSLGALNSATRTPDQTESARFWAGTVAALGYWNRAAVTASANRHLPLSQNARLFALLNTAVADTLIVCWDSKRHFNYWRPITAIHEAGNDGNPATTGDANWAPLITTPPYPDYFSGHQSVSGAAAFVLTAYFGHQPVEGTSEGLPGVTRAFASFAAAAADANLSRVWAGIHFRFTQLRTRVVAEQVAAYVLTHAAQPLRGKHTGPTPD